MIGIAAAPDFTEDLMWDNFSEDEKNKIIRHGVIKQNLNTLMNLIKFPKTLYLNQEIVLFYVIKLN